jgi:hypothetical protein
MTLTTKLFLYGNLSLKKGGQKKGGVAEVGEGFGGKLRMRRVLVFKLR